MNHKFYTLFINYCNGGSDFAIFTSLKSLYKLLTEFIKESKIKEVVEFTTIKEKIDGGLFFTHEFESSDWICIQGTNNEEDKIINSYNEVMGNRKETI